MACSVLAATLLLSGCGGSDAESELQTQQMLDEGNYEGVIAKITNPETNEDYMALAAAYMQRAGLGLADLVTVIADSTEDENDEAFAAFVKSVEEKSSSTALQDLEKSARYYKDVVMNCTSTTLSTSQEDACLYRGLAQTMKASATIGYIADDISNFGTSGSTDNKLKASTCAMEYASNGNIQSTDCTLFSGPTPLMFANNVTYNSLTISVNGESFENLIREINGTKATVITNGYCATNDFTTRVEDKNATTYDPAIYHVCPVIETADAADELTTEGLIVEALNDGVESIGGIATEDMQADIDEFKCEVLGGTYSEYNGCINNTSGLSINLETTSVTTAEVIDYLNNNN